MLCRDIAEVVHVESGNEGPTYLSYDFESWAEVSTARDSFASQPHDWVRTVRMEIAVPKIIRLLGYDRLPEQVVKLNRRNLFARDRNVCAYCGDHFHEDELTREHIIPFAQNGRDHWMNVVTACRACNHRKSNRTPEQARMPLIYAPYVPSLWEDFILRNRRILADQMEFLMAHLPKTSRLHAC